MTLGVIIMSIGREGLVCAVKNFLCLRDWFLFVFWSLFLILYVVLGAVWGALGCGFMLFGVRSSAFQCCRESTLGMLSGGLRAEKIQKKKATIHLRLLLPCGFEGHGEGVLARFWRG